MARRLGVTSVLETHGHWDHIGAVEAVREAGIDVWVRTEDAGMLPSYDHLLDDDVVHQVGDLRLRTLHTPGHTPGSICFALEETPMLFTGDTLFPGGPGNTNHDATDFATIITSIDERIFGVFADDVTIWPGHGARVHDRHRATPPRRVGRTGLVTTGHRRRIGPLGSSPCRRPF